MKKLIFFLLLSILITGCASQRNKCKYGKGIACMGLTEMDNMDINSVEEKSSKKTKLEPISMPKSLLRTQEEVLTVWIAPYQTKNGTYHGEKILYFVAKPAQWTVNLEIGSE